jgi:hypothetical protein
MVIHLNLKSRQKQITMTNLFEITAKEIKEILTEKGISFEYTIGDYNRVWIGLHNKSVCNWIGFTDENSLVIFAETYSKNTGKSSKGFSARNKVYSYFDKFINN